MTKDYYFETLTSAGVSSMSGAELRCLREWLGLTTRWLAEHLDVAERSVHRWESNVQRIPEGVAAEVLRLSQLTHEVLDGLALDLLDKTDPGVAVTYRTEEDYHAHRMSILLGEPLPVEWPASWHRAMCARLVDQVPGLRITYWTRPE